MTPPTLDALDATLAQPEGPFALRDDVSLGATLAAPLPLVVSEAARRTTTLTTSVLPRVESESEGVRLVPTEGPRYENEKLLGEGGMGEVALALDRDIGRKVALKRLRAGGAASSGAALARFVDEVRTVGQLEHPNIVPIHDVGVDEHGNYFFVMKYVAGDTLEGIIEKLKAKEPETTARYTVLKRLEVFVGLLRALDCAHQHGIIHRDIKPANVMVGANGEVMLMDWGVARPIARTEPDAPAGAPVGDPGGTQPARASVTRVGALIGTPLYMSPEQAAGRNSQLDARSDLYAACSVFYELLSLHHRFEGKDTLVQLLAAIQSTDTGETAADFYRAHLGPAAVPADLIHFLRKGLALDPKDRWQSAGEMLFELEAIADGRCRVQCGATALRRGTREFTRLLDRNPAGAFALVGGVAASLLGLLGVAVFGLLT
jgi:serine/threonine protein kinase